MHNAAPGFEVDGGRDRTVKFGQENFAPDIFEFAVFGQLMGNGNEINAHFRIVVNPGDSFENLTVDMRVEYFFIMQKFYRDIHAWMRFPEHCCDYRFFRLQIMRLRPVFRDYSGNLFFVQIFFFICHHGLCAHNPDFHFGRDIVVKFDFDFKLAKLLERFFHFELLMVNMDAQFREFVRDIPGADRTEQLVVA